MPLTVLDPRTALIVIDLQQGIAAMATSRPAAAVAQKAAALAEAFRRHDLPVVLVNVTGAPPGRTDRPRMAGPFPPGFADFMPELNRQPSDHVVTKQTRGAFTGTDLDAWLKGQGVTQVVIVGIATSAGVASTALFAQELGYNVTLATDAMTDRSPELHDHAVANLFPSVGETGTTADVLALLDLRS